MGQCSRLSATKADSALKFSACEVINNFNNENSIISMNTFCKEDNAFKRLFEVHLNDLAPVMPQVDRLGSVCKAGNSLQCVRVVIFGDDSNYRHPLPHVNVKVLQPSPLRSQRWKSPSSCCRTLGRDWNMGAPAIGAQCQSLERRVRNMAKFWNSANWSLAPKIQQKLFEF